MEYRLVPSRLPASLLASAGLHALGLAVAIHLVGVLAVPRELPQAAIIPVSLVSLPGGGGGPKGNGTPAPPAPLPPALAAAATERAAPPPPAPAPKPLSRKKPAPPAKAVPTTDAPPVMAAVAPTSAGGASRSGGATTGARGGGDGTGGDGSGGAHPAYGANPRPPYPVAARRLGLEGRVLLEVVVQPDGRAASVAVRESSGHRLLDDSATETVRRRWRFVPARRGGVAVESRVTVPIRFRLRES